MPIKKTMRLSPGGTRDWLFEECRARQTLSERLLALFEERGFSRVCTPGLEYYDLFAPSCGVGAAIPPEQMYKLCDGEGQLLVLRPDSTVPIARMAAARLRGATLPVRLCYAQEVYRAHRGHSGRYDEQLQAGAELFSVPNVSGAAADMEMLTLAAQALRRCVGEDFRLELGHVGLTQRLLAALPTDEDTREELRGLVEVKDGLALEAALAEFPDGAAKEAVLRLPHLFGDAEVLAQARALCRDGETAAVLDYLETLYAALCEAGLRAHVLLDLALPRRHAYYDGIVFHGYVEGGGEAAVTGGRYDALMRRFGLDWGAAGFAVNVDSLAVRQLAQGEATL